jgi:peptidoglycan/LPS O-acetylase OafA/YrhL
MPPAPPARQRSGTSDEVSGILASARKAARLKKGRYGTSVPMTADQRPPTPKSGARSRLAVLDGLRLLAATMVVFYHYVGVPNAKIGHQGRTEVLAWGTSAANVFPHSLHQAATYGWTGVELFFMISGFVICMSGWGRRPADFFVSRVVRLVPAYWAATALTAVVLMTFPRLTAGIQPSMVLTNFTMVQSAYGVTNLVPAYWTLFVELTFYLLFGLVAIGGVNYRRMVTFCVLWSVASIAAASSHNPVLNMIINPSYSPYFVAGIAFFLIYKFGSNLLLWAIVAYSWLISVNQPHTNPPPQVVILISSFFVIMAVVATHRLDRIRWRWLTVAGALTYPLYLIHQDIGFTVISYLRNSVPPLALAGLTYVAMLVAAWLIHRLVERPVAPLLKARLSEAVSRVRLSGPQPALAMAGAAGSGGSNGSGGSSGSNGSGGSSGSNGSGGSSGSSGPAAVHQPARCADPPRRRWTAQHPRSVPGDSLTEVAVTGRAPGNGMSGNGHAGHANGTPANGTPANGTSGNGTPGNGTPGNGTPGNGTPGNGTPGNGTPANGTPGNGTPANGTPANGPSGHGMRGSSRAGNGAHPNGGNGSEGAHADSAPDDGAHATGTHANGVHSNGVTANGASGNGRR